MRHARSILINAKPDRVWELIDDDSKLPLWMPSVVSTRYPNGRRQGNPIGTRFVQEMREGKRVVSYEGEVTEYEPGRTLGIALWPAPFVVHVIYCISADGVGSRLDYRAEVTPALWLGWLLLPFGRLFLGRSLDQQLARLKQVAEAAHSQSV